MSYVYVFIISAARPGPCTLVKMAFQEITEQNHKGGEVNEVFSELQLV